MSTTPTVMSLRVAVAEPAARGIQRFELRHPEGAELPAFTAGAHIRIKTPSGAMRQYSLSNDPAERDRYVIAVKREGNGRGGSLSLVDGVRAGTLVEVGAPENLFELDPKAKGFILIAGGIGITPMMAMARHLLAEGTRKFKLYYLTRDAEGSAFLDELTGPEFAPHVKVHHDQGDPGQAFDLWPVLEKPGSANGQHVYCCGPTPLMDAVRDMTGHWPSSAVHFESFGGDTKPHADDQPFEVRLEHSGRTVEVPVGVSILDALRLEGVHVPSSCESGTCGSCKTRLLEGEADHRDLVLLDEEKADHIMVCVSRAKTPCLVLDL
jgi:phthalate 4,5-dioxygenase reductase component